MTRLLLGLILLAVNAVGAGEGSVDTTRLLQQYIRIDTTNPPGNELAAVKFLGDILTREGIAFEAVETGPGRGNIWARLEGGDEPGIVLLHHMDVVSADASAWSADPFAGDIRDGHIYGRGALDMKSHGIIHLAALIALHRANLPMNRDVLFLATADEEAGAAYGMQWLVDKRPEVLDGIGFGITEGGGGSIVANQRIFSIEVTQKLPLWLRMEAGGEAGHGSTPRVSNAVNRLLTALDKLRAHRFTPRIIPAADAYFQNIAPQFGGKMQAALQAMPGSVNDEAFMQQLHSALPNLHALTQNTCTITRLFGSDKINVVPANAAAEIDCRLLPDEDVEAFLDTVAAVIDDPSVTITPLLKRQPRASSTDTVLYRTIAATMARHYPDAAITPSVSAGFTDGQYLRGLEIATYGFAPFMVPVEDLGGFHGKNERISVENMRVGAEQLLEILQSLVYSQ